MRPKLNAFFGFLDKFWHPLNDLQDNDSLRSQHVNGLKFKLFLVHEPWCLTVHLKGGRWSESELLFLNSPEFVQKIVWVDPDAGLPIVGEKTAFFVDDA